MCGIVGYTGTLQAKGVLLEGLKRLEYRGYDSAGIAVESGEGINVVKRLGKVSGLVEAIQDDMCQGTCGIGHTRWATHGAPSERNAHPHTGCSNDVVVVHNGIIENFAELREELEAKGHKFSSDTDTECIAHLVEENYHGDLFEAVRVVSNSLSGAYGLAVMHHDHPGEIVVTRKDSPIVLGVGENGSYLGSDIIALIDATRDVVILEDGQLAVMHPDHIDYFDAQGNPVTPETTHVDWDIDVAEKGGYPDFMLKEIHEQPRVVRDTLAGRMSGHEISIDELTLSRQELNYIDRVYLIGCGTSYHAGLIAKNLIEGWARIPTEVEVASEFRYRNPIITPTTLVVAVSQSGETADTLAAIRDARIKGAKVFGITNVIGSPVARESDGVIYTKANKEVAVASTKSFIGQVVSLTLLALLLGRAKGKLTLNQTRMLFTELADTADQIEEILQDVVVSDPEWKVILLRYFNPVGAHKSGRIGENPRGIPNNLTPYITQVAVGKLDHVNVFGNDYDTPDGTGVRDYIHVVDLALGHVKAIEKINAMDGGVKIYNLGTGIGYSVLEVIEAFRKATGKEIPYVIGPRRAGDIATCYAATDKAEKELGWKAQRGLDEMCEDAWRWQSMNPDGYPED